MSFDLSHFLARHTPACEEHVVWADGRLPFHVTHYLAAEPPPIEMIVSVRALVFRDDAILVGRNRHGVHIMPGGRREPGEKLEETLRREVLEETGWALDGLRQLGFARFHHLAPKLPDYPYSYPDFFWLIYVAEATALMPELLLDDGYELEARFYPLDEARLLEISAGERVYFEAALSRRSTF